MKQLKDMPGICKYCIADCLKLENENFNGVYRCKDFEPNQISMKEVESKIREELRKK